MRAVAISLLLLTTTFSMGSAMACSESDIVLYDNGIVAVGHRTTHCDDSWEVSHTETTYLRASDNRVGPVSVDAIEVAFEDHDERDPRTSSGHRYLLVAGFPVAGFQSAAYQAGDSYYFYDGVRVGWAVGAGVTSVKRGGDGMSCIEHRPGVGVVYFGASQSVGFCQDGSSKRIFTENAVSRVEYDFRGQPVTPTGVRAYNDLVQYHAGAERPLHCDGYVAASARGTTLAWVPTGPTICSIV